MGDMPAPSDQLKEAFAQVDTQASYLILECCLI